MRGISATPPRLPVRYDEKGVRRGPPGMKGSLFVTDRVPVGRTSEEQAEEEAFQALYGEWAPITPVDFAREMEGFERPWWVVGGWAIEAATGYRREHEDTDVSILACDVPAFVEFMKGRWHVWNNVGGVPAPSRRPLDDRR